MFRVLLSLVSTGKNLSRTLGTLLYACCEELQQAGFAEALMLLLSLPEKALINVVGISKELICSLVQRFLNELQPFYKKTAASFRIFTICFLLIIKHMRTLCGVRKLSYYLICDFGSSFVYTIVIDHTKPIPKTATGEISMLHITVSSRTIKEKTC